MGLGSGDGLRAMGTGGEPWDRRRDPRTGREAESRGGRRRAMGAGGGTERQSEGHGDRRRAMGTGGEPWDRQRDPRTGKRAMGAGGGTERQSEGHGDRWRAMGTGRGT